MNNRKNIFILTTKLSGSRYLGELFQSMRNYKFNDEVWSLNVNPNFQEVGRIATIMNNIKSNEIHNVFTINLPQFFVKGCDVTIKDLYDKIHNPYFIVLNNYDKLEQYIEEIISRKSEIKKNRKVNFNDKKYYSWLETNLSYYRYILKSLKEYDYLDMDYTNGFSSLQLDSLCDFLETENNFKNRTNEFNNVVNYIENIKDIGIPFNRRFISVNDILIK